MFKQTGPWRFSLFSSMIVAGLWLLWKGGSPRADKPGSGAMQTPAMPNVSPRGEETQPLRQLPGLSVLLPWAAYLGIIAAAELSMAGNPWVALSLYVYLLFFLVAHALLFRPAEKPMAAALALAPATRVLGVLAGTAEPSLHGWYLLTGASLVAVGALVAGFLGLSRRQLGLTPGKLFHQLAVALLGLPLAAAGYLLLRPSPLGAGMSGVEFWALALLLLLATGPAEEFLFRGVVQSTALPVLGRWGLVYASGLFALLQAAAGGPVQGIYWFVVGLAFSWLVLRTGSLLGVSLAHGLATAGIYLVIPLLLAGSASTGALGGLIGLFPDSAAFPADGSVSLLAARPSSLPGVARPGVTLAADGAAWEGRLAEERPGPRLGAVAPSGFTAGAATPSADQRAVLGATPVPVPTHSAAPVKTVESYTVQPGDGLFGIAESHGTTVEVLMALNGLTDRSFIRSGQTLILPGTPSTPSPAVGPALTPGPITTLTMTPMPSATPPRTATPTTVPTLRATASPTATPSPRSTATPTLRPTSTPASSAGWEPYRVKAGDSLFGIAMSRGTTVEELMSRNGLTDRASIYSGQVILVPVPTR